MREQRVVKREEKMGKGWSQMVGITAFWQKGAPFRRRQSSTRLGQDAQEEPAVQPGLGDAARPLLAAVRPLPVVPPGLAFSGCPARGAGELR